MFLIIDDNQTDRLIARLLLENEYSGEKVVEAGSARDGIEWLKNNLPHQGLRILLDIKMPEIDGFGFLELYDELPDSVKQNTTVFMISSTLDPGDIQRANDNHYVKKLLEKPLNPTVISM